MNETTFSTEQLTASYFTFNIHSEPKEVVATPIISNERLQEVLAIRDRKTACVSCHQKHIACNKQDPCYNCYVTFRSVSMTNPQRYLDKRYLAAAHFYYLYCLQTRRYPFCSE